MTATFRVDGPVVVDLRNSGGAGSVRLRGYWRNRFAGSPIIDCAEPPAFALAAGATASRTVACTFPQTDITVDWLVVESQNANGTWARTACAARATACPASLQAER